MKVLGIGNTGAKLASLFDKEAILFSTATQDTENFKDYNVIEMGDDGCGKKFGTGLKLWKNKIQELKEILKNVENENVILFSSLGGGSGSSSLVSISNILKKQNNNILIAGVVPYKSEQLPPIANAVQSISSLMNIIDDVSVILFDNESLLKQYKNNWNNINSHIVRKVGYLTGLLNDYTQPGYSPLTIDESEYESVVFGGGFIDISNEFIEDAVPKFSFGKLDSETKNLLVGMVADSSLEKGIIDEYHTILTNIVTTVAKRAKNARLVPGILRGRISKSTGRSRAYVTIASGLSLDGYLKQLSRMRDDAISRASKFSQKREKKEIVSKKEFNLLDI